MATAALPLDEKPGDGRTPASPGRSGERTWSASVRAHQFSLRAVLVGLLVGSLMCLSNMYFGLQTGWVTMGSLQSTVLGFGLFRVLGSRFEFFRGFSALENVVVQTVAVACATMPLAGGFVGIVPALGMLTEEEDSVSPLRLSVGEQLLWCAALAFFGVFFAVPLRTHTILKAKLRFPSGTATAEMIAVLHRLPRLGEESSTALRPRTPHSSPPAESETEALVPSSSSSAAASALSSSTSSAASASAAVGMVSLEVEDTDADAGEGEESPEAREEARAWTLRGRILGFTFGASFLYTLVTHFVPVLQNMPVLSWCGWPVASEFGWTLTPSPSYMGQGMIMGVFTTTSMLGGAVLGGAILGPVARNAGWAPGAIGSSSNGARGWVTWVSLAVLLGDSVASLGHMIWTSIRPWIPCVRASSSKSSSPLAFSTTPSSSRSRTPRVPLDPAPAEEQVPRLWWLGGLGASTTLCVAVLAPVFDMPVYEPIVAVLVSLLVAVLAVRALGETDLNPVSGVGKLSQLVFAGVSPGHVITNVVAGAVAEAGAQQAGDMMQDLKTGHLLRASPRAQFWGQLVGSSASVLLTVAAYQLFSHAYTIGGAQLPAPTAHIWVDMARLVNGGSLPPKAALVGGILGGVTFVVALFKIAMGQHDTMEGSGRGVETDETELLAGDEDGGRQDRRALEDASPWASSATSATSATSAEANEGTALRAGAVRTRVGKAVAGWLPSMVALAVGMYITPNWTLPRVVGALVQAAWKRRSPETHDAYLLLVATGFVLGEGIASVLNAVLTTAGSSPWTCAGCDPGLCSGC